MSEYEPKVYYHPLGVNIWNDPLVGKEPTCQCWRHETQVPSLGEEDPLEEGMATHSSILAWRIPMDKEAWWAIIYRVENSWTLLKRQSTLVGRPKTQ